MPSGEETEMAQTMKTMQVLGMSGSLAGTSQFVDNSVSLQSAKGLSKCRRPAFSVRAHVKDEHSTLAVTTPATITSIVVLADAGAANALTSEDVTGTVLKVRESPSEFSPMYLVNCKSQGLTICRNNSTFLLFSSERRIQQLVNIYVHKISLRDPTP